MGVPRLVRCRLLFQVGRGSIQALYHDVQACADRCGARGHGVVCVVIVAANVAVLQPPACCDTLLLIASAPPQPQDRSCPLTPPPQP